MTDRVLTESLVRALVAEAGAEDADIIGVRAAPRWGSPATLEHANGGATTIRVAACPSVLAVHDAVAAHRRAEGELLVIVTDRDERELGADLLASLWRGELHRAYGWEACKRLFRVDQLDPTLADQRWLVDLLVDIAPPRGYAPPPSGVLDAATAWQTFLRHGLHLDSDRTDLHGLLTWTDGERATPALTAFDDDSRAEIVDRLVADLGPAAAPVLRLVADGRGRDALALGLVCDALWTPAATGEAVVAARARLDERLGRTGLSAAAARQWGDAAVDLVDDALDGGAEAAVAPLLADAEQRLADLGAPGHAAASNVLPAGLALRLADAGRCLGAALASGAVDEAALAAVGRVRRHRHTRRGKSGALALDRLEHAVRLLRWLATAETFADGDLASLARLHVTDTSWVDTARAVLAEGSDVDELAAVYARLLEQIDRRRDTENRAFARALVDRSAVAPVGEDGPLLPVEGVLDRVVAPLAAQQPVLMVVVDGLSHAQAHRLVADLHRQGWRLHEPAAPWTAAVAALPTVTAASRTSLLCGRLVAGGQADEKAGFAGHAGLRAAGGREPALYHKADLRPEEGKAAPVVRDAILDRDRRVVGVVVNGADDHLRSGAQIRPMDGVDGIKPLDSLLAAALEAGRVVVLASDHGHVLERDSKRVEPTGGGGERWCPATRDPGPDELRAEGPRVLLGDGAVLAPAVEGVRYINSRNHGYHGGLTPQEALCPLVVLAPASLPLDGWDATAPAEPAWWALTGEAAIGHGQAGDASASQRSTGRASAPSPVRRSDAEGAPTLFTDDADAAADAGTAGDAGRETAAAIQGADRPVWVDALLASPVLADQRRLAGRRALPDDDIADLLGILDRHGGVASRGTLLRETGVPLSRLVGKLEALRALLNVDGYEALTVERDEGARLNRALLVNQFGLDDR